ncbi:MAG: hypothetical protein IIA72_06215 [Proteobacteria bacterium]|nr:hypothetical protein [Pseudomonadota bacterium]
MRFSINNSKNYLITLAMIVFANRSQKHVAIRSQVRCNTHEILMVLLAWFVGTPDHRNLAAPGKAEKTGEYLGDAIS